MKVIPKELFLAVKVFVDKNPEIIWKFMFRKLKKAIETEKEKVYLFRVEGIPYVALIKQEDYINSLTSIMEHFVKVEEYETAKECQNLIDLHKINTIINESKLGV